MDEGEYSEVWHTERWRNDLPSDVVSPMYNAGVRHYYIDELVRLKDGNFAIPLRWVKYQGQMHAIAVAVVSNQGVRTFISYLWVTLLIINSLGCSRHTKGPSLHG